MGTQMNRFVVLAACVCASSAQFLAPAHGVIAAAPVARAFAPAPVQTSQFHAQDEFGQYTFGYSGGPSARTESRDAYGVVTGSFQEVDANGIIQTVNYRADPINGFQRVGTNSPVGPAPLEVTPLAAPVFNPEPLVAPVFNPAPLVAPVDTPEVAADKAEHAAAHAALASRKRRSAQLIAAAPALGYAHGLPLAGLYAGAPADIVANIAPAVPTAAVAPVAAVAPAALSPALAYNTVSAPAAREAILTTIKLNPGHATFYRVD